MIRALVLALLLLTAQSPFHSSTRPLPVPVKAELKQRGFWHKGCRSPLSGLRAAHRHAPRLRRARPYRRSSSSTATPRAPLARVFRRLYHLHFPIRHMRSLTSTGRSARGPPMVT